jgi:hypothetical protein
LGEHSDGDLPWPAGREQEDVMISHTHCQGTVRI